MRLKNVQFRGSSVVPVEMRGGFLEEVPFIGVLEAEMRKGQPE